MKKISEKQLKQLEKDIVISLHSLCPKTLSGKHKWIDAHKKDFIGGPRIYLGYKECQWCGMKKI